MKILITGVLGFIGFHLSKSLLEQNFIIHGIDNDEQESYKSHKLEILLMYPKFHFQHLDLSNLVDVENLEVTIHYDLIIHLAAKSGVRGSFKLKDAYFNNNVIGFYNLLEFARKNHIHKLIFASSSAVYGNNTSTPLNEEITLKPNSFYGSTKQICEVLAESYSANFNMTIVGLRLFTVYGSYPRQNMALFNFITGIYNGHKIDVYNMGRSMRCYTYIDDIIGGIYRIIENLLNVKSSYQVYNLGNELGVSTLDVINTIEKELNKKATLILLPANTEEMDSNIGDMSKFFTNFDYKCQSNFNLTIPHVIDWYKQFIIK